MTTPMLSVLIDTYNHERFIEEAIVSVLEQDFPSSEMEILVVDDGSTDGTPEIVKKFAPQLRYLRKENGGQASAFNLGIPEARGEIIAFLDGDDWWEKSKVTEVMTTFEKNPWAGVVGHGIIQHDFATGSSSAISPEFPGCFDIQSAKGAQTFRDYMCFLGTSRVSIRQSVLGKVMPIPHALVVEADEFMSAMSIAYSSAVLLPACLTHYRLHDQNQYQFSADDPTRMRRKLNSLTCLAQELIMQLSAGEIPRESILIIVDPILVTVGRMKLALDGGMPWQTYFVEQDDFRLNHSSAPFGYRVYKQLSLLLTLILPPRTFYKLRNIYSEKNLRRYRGWTGEPSPAAAIREKALSRGTAAGK
ncbi:MAG TPA: glycosyltransferase family A protein [Candidatus Acidoferrales bacterium]